MLCRVVEEVLTSNLNGTFEEGLLLHNYNPNYERSCECGCEGVYIAGGYEPYEAIKIELKINRDKIECHDLSR